MNLGITSAKHSRLYHCLYQFAARVSWVSFDINFDFIANYTNRVCFYVKLYEYIRFSELVIICIGGVINIRPQTPSYSLLKRFKGTLYYFSIYRSVKHPQV